MKRFCAFHPLLLLLLLLGGSLLMPRSAEAAVTCSAQFSGSNTLNFGTYDPQTGASTAQITMTWSCTNNTFLSGGAVTACFSIGTGTNGSGQINPRQINGSTGSPLQYQIYKDSSQSQMWGSVLTNATEAITEKATFPLLGNQTQGGTLTLYASMPGNQIGVTAGTFASSFSGINAMMSFSTTTAFLGSPNPPASCGSDPDITFPFNVLANVQRTCTVTAGAASNIDFGDVSANTAGTLSRTSNIQVTCLTGTPYIVGLATTDGDNGTGHMSGIDPGNATDTVAYTLRRTSAAGAVWGNTGTSPGAATQGNDVSGNGNGLSQSIPVYAVVTDTNHVPGHYVDTVTVHVTY